MPSGAPVHSSFTAPQKHSPLYVVMVVFAFPSPAYREGHIGDGTMKGLDRPSVILDRASMMPSARSKKKMPGASAGQVKEVQG
jgi:hypothetical protein